MTYKLDRNSLRQQVMSPESNASETIIHLSSPNNYRQWLYGIETAAEYANEYMNEFVHTGDIQSMKRDYDLSANDESFVKTVFNSFLVKLYKKTIVGEAAYEMNWICDDSPGRVSAYDIFSHFEANYIEVTIGSRLTLIEDLPNISSKPVDEIVSYLKTLFTMLEDNSEEQDKKKQRDTNIALLLMTFLPELKESFHEKFGDSKALQLSKVVRFCKLKASSNLSSSVADALVAQNKRGYHRKGNKGCMICGADHRLSNCSLLKKRIPEARIFKLYSSDKSSTPSSASMAMTDYETQPNKENQKPSTSWLCMLSSITPATKSSEWIFDTGCTSHMCHNRSMFSSFTRSSKKDFVRGVGGSIPILGSGTVNIGTVQLNDVSYVPDLPVNLISIWKLCAKSNSSVTFTKEGVTVKSPDDVVSKAGKLKNYLYIFDDLTPVNARSSQNYSLSRVLDSSKTITTTAFHTVVDQMLPQPISPTAIPVKWHARMGHPGADIFNSLARTLHLPKLKTVGYTICPTCSLAKGTIKKGKVSLKRYTQPLQMVQADLCGGFRYQEFQSNKYFLTIRDAYSRYYSVIHLKSKADAPVKFMEWITETEQYFSSRGGFKVGSVRTDNGTEFVNKNLHAFFKSKGIEHQLTIPYQSYQNGAVERAHRTIEERTRCLLIGGRVPPSLWSEAVSCAVYLINRSPVVSKNNSIPYCLWFNIPAKDFGIAHLRIFGCTAYATLQHTLRDGKLAPTVISGVMVGYDSNHQGYRIYHPETGRIFVSSQVRFDEHVFPLADTEAVHVSHDFATSAIGGVSKYPQTGSIISAPRNNGPELPNKSIKTFTKANQPEFKPNSNSTYTSDDDEDISMETEIDKSTPEVNQEKLPTSESPTTRIQHSNFEVLPSVSTEDETNSSMERTPERVPTALTYKGIPQSSDSEYIPTRRNKTRHVKRTIKKPTRSREIEIYDISRPNVISSDNLPEVRSAKQRKTATNTNDTVASTNRLPTILRTLDSNNIDTLHVASTGEEVSIERLSSMALQEANNNSARTNQANSLTDWFPVGAMPIPDQRYLFIHDGTYISDSQDVGDTDVTPAVTRLVTEETSIEYLPSLDSSPPNTSFNAALTAIIHSTKTGNPKTYAQAIERPDFQEWHNACLKELSAFKDHKTYRLVPLPEQRRALGSRWVFTIKDSGTYKARLVAQGHTQKAGIDYQETFAPVIRYDSVRIFLALASCLKLTVYQMDVDTAFLNSSMSEPVYVKQPPGFINEHKPDHVWELYGGMYGLKQAPLLWNEHINSTLQKVGFCRHEGEHGLYFRSTSDGPVYIALYVDDLLVAAPSPRIYNRVKQELTRSYSMKDLGKVDKFLGLNIHQSSNGNITLSLQDYIAKATSASEINISKPTLTPLGDSKPLFATTSPFLKDITIYQSIVGQLLFCANTGRPDISYPVSLLSRFLREPRSIHLESAKRVLRYLYTTRRMCLKYRSGSPMELTVYCDASHGAIHDLPHSTGGYVTLLAGAPVTWSSKKLKGVIPVSSTEAEYITASETVMEIEWIQNLFEHLAQPLVSSKLYVDNEPAIKLSKHPVFHTRTKHIALRYHKLRSAVAAGIISIEHVITKKQVADIFTKILPAESFKLHRSVMMTEAEIIK